MMIHDYDIVKKKIKLSIIDELFDKKINILVKFYYIKIPILITVI